MSRFYSLRFRYELAMENVTVISEHYILISIVFLGGIGYETKYAVARFIRFRGARSAVVARRHNKAANN